jgi:ABC-2 type transport system permease protein
MKKTFFVLITEIVNTVMRPSFFIITFGLPVIAFVLFTVFTNASESDQQSITSLIAPSDEIETQGYVDQSGLIEVLPSEVTEEMLVAYPDESSAHAALEQGEIAAYYLIPEDVVETGELLAVTSDFNPVSYGGNQWVMDWTLMVNIVGGDEKLASQIQYPMRETRISVDGEVGDDEENPLSFGVPYAVTLFFYMIIFGSASLMLNSIGKEKQNRVLEVLLLSVSPKQLLMGKIIGLGLVGLLQTFIYTSIGATLLKISGRSFEAAANFNLPTGLVWWGLLFFLLGYSIYASLMAGAGALAPNTREASQITFILIIPLIVPLFFISSLIQDPNSTLSVVISMFPFSAPVAMMTRLAATSVPIWQIALTIVLMLATAYLVISMVARLFRAQTMLSGQEFKPGLYLKALIGKY